MVMVLEKCYYAGSNSRIWSILQQKKKIGWLIMDESYIFVSLNDALTSVSDFLKNNLSLKYKKKKPTFTTLVFHALFEGSLRLTKPLEIV